MSEKMSDVNMVNYSWYRCTDNESGNELCLFYSDGRFFHSADLANEYPRGFINVDFIMVNGDSNQELIAKLKKQRTDVYRCFSEENEDNNRLRAEVAKQAEQIELLRDALKKLVEMSISDQEVLGSEFGGGRTEAEIRANGNMADEILNAESALAATAKG